jgi:riboflavin kinase / FMN adenylyltransferase
MMRTTDGIEGLRRISAGSVMSIGNFDGMHLGHAKILQSMRALRSDASPLVVVTFEPHPFTVLRPQFAPPRLTPPDVKRHLLESAGVDELVILPPTREVLGTSAEQFWEILRDEVRPAHLVEGASFSFGKGRGGNVEKLRKWSAGSAVKLHVIDSVEVVLLNLHLVQVSSSLVRWLIAYGRVRDAAICLGREYALSGKVIRGHGRGKKLGIPTANLDCDDQLIPADGVYAALCEIDGKIYPVALSIGSTPTFAENRRQVEAHLIGFDADLYDRVLHVELIDWLRDQLRFSDVASLTSQIQGDISVTRNTFLAAASRLASANLA